jgi:predicted Rossmann-fold nucleotide-binding protein
MLDDTRKLVRSGSRPPSGRDLSRTPPADNGPRNETTGRKPGRNARRLITVFGSSRARGGDELYVEAWRMGQLLGQSGFDVATGGYSGVMEAVSRGAHEAGAHVVGVTMKTVR